MLEWDEFTSFCDMRRKSHIAPPPRSLTPPPERLAPVDPGPSTSWVTWSPDAVASTGPQIDAGPSTEDPWVVNPSDTLAAAEPTPPNPRGQLSCILLHQSKLTFFFQILFAGLGNLRYTSTLIMPCSTYLPVSRGGNW
jgi:hypothetical protein